VSASKSATNGHGWRATRQRGVQVLLWALAATCLPALPAAAQAAPAALLPDLQPAVQPPPDRAAWRAGLAQALASQEVQALAGWVVDVTDNHGLPFLLVDKKEARVFAFDASGRLRGAAPALLGLAIGDDAVPGIGERKLSDIRPDERTTPAGRFVASLDRNLHGQEILWVDYDTAISLHRVVAGTPSERRAQRLASPTPLDNRISYGCINVPVRFYEEVVSPAFTGTDGIVYVMPETRSAREVFGSPGVQASAETPVRSRRP